MRSFIIGLVGRDSEGGSFVFPGLLCYFISFSESSCFPMKVDQLFLFDANFRSFLLAPIPPYFSLGSSSDLNWDPEIYMVGWLSPRWLKLRTQEARKDQVAPLMLGHLRQDMFASYDLSSRTPSGKRKNSFWGIQSYSIQYTVYRVYLLMFVVLEWNLMSYIYIESGGLALGRFSQQNVHVTK